MPEVRAFFLQRAPRRARAGPAFRYRAASISIALPAGGVISSPASGAEEPSTASVSERFSAHLSRRPDLLPPDSRIVLAVSGGPDSVALLHLAHSLAEEHRWQLVAAHFDHGLRDDSIAEAEQVAAWVDALGIRCHVGRPERPLDARQAALRDARYAFLRAVTASEDARRMATAHHADDQAETVLFRVLRGTGVRGLAGIPERRGSIVRPLLGFWRAELEAYLTERSIAYLTDPSNTDPRWARARLRTQLLPAMESAWEGPVRERLVELARSAADADRALLEQAKEALRASSASPRDKGVQFVRSVFCRSHPIVQARALAVLAERLEDVRLSRGGTRVAVEFIKGGRSGASMDIGRGLTLRREFDYLWLGVPNAEERSRSLTVPAEGSGTETVSLDGRVFRVSWKRDAQSERPESALSAENVLQVPSDAVLPLEVRARRPGDGIRLRGGRRKLKRLLIDCRVPVSERSRIPVLSDAQGRILWVWGVARAESRPAAGGLEETRQVPTMIEIEELESARNGSSG